MWVQFELIWSELFAESLLLLICNTTWHAQFLVWERELGAISVEPRSCCHRWSDDRFQQWLLPAWKIQQPLPRWGSCTHHPMSWQPAVLYHWTYTKMTLHSCIENKQLPPPPLSFTANHKRRGGVGPPAGPNIQQPYYRMLVFTTFSYWCLLLGYIKNNN